MYCSNCGKQISENAKFCHNCGAKQPEPIIVTPHTQITPIEPAPVEPKIEPAPVEPKIEPTPAEQKDNIQPPMPTPNPINATPKKRRKKWLIPVVIAIVLVVAIVLSVIPMDTPSDYSYNDESKTTTGIDTTNSTSPDSPPPVGGSQNNNPQSPSFEPVGPSGTPVDFTRTVLIYIVGSNLESEYGAATDDIQEMFEAEIDNSKTKVLLCAGGSNKWNNNTISPSETSYYQVTNEDVTKVKQLSKNNMGSSSTLSDFLKWSVSNYPSDRYDLFFWNHGGGPVYGYGNDELSNDELSISELVYALKSSPFGSNKKLEVIGFDACIMGSTEIAWSFKDYAQYYVGSQELEPGYGWDYSFLTKLHYCHTGGDVGKLIVDSYFDFYNKILSSVNYSNSELTLSCIDLSKIDNVKNAVETVFSNINNDVLAGKIGTVSRCRYATKAFAKSGTTHSYDLVDLKHLASLLSSTYPKAADLMSSVDSAVVYTKSNVKNANGLSIYHPYNISDYSTNIKREYDSLGFATKYSQYISNFMSCMNSNSQSSSSYKEFSKTMGTATSNDQKTDLSIQLTEEQMKTFSSAKYYVFWEMPDTTTFSKKTEYLQVFSGQDVNVSSDGKLTATYEGKAVFGKDQATGKYSDCPLSMNQIYDGSLEEKFYFPCMFWFFGDNLNIDIENVNWLMKIQNGVPTLGNAYFMQSESGNPFPDKQLVNPDNYSIYGFMNNSYFVSKDDNLNTVFQASGSVYGFEYKKEDGFSLELRSIPDKSQYRAVFLIEDIYGNSYFSDFIPLA